MMRSCNINSRINVINININVNVRLLIIGIELGNLLLSLLLRFTSAAKQRPSEDGEREISHSRSPINNYQVIVNS